MSKKKNPHERAVSLEESEAYIVPLNDVVSTKKFSRMFRETIMKRYSPEQYHLIAHFLDTFPLSKEIDHAVPLPGNVLRKYLPTLYYDSGLAQLLEDGVFERDWFSKEEHKCYYYTAGPALREWLEQEEREAYITSLIDEPLVRMATGKLAPSFTHQLKVNGYLLPKLNRAALETIKTNVIDYQRLEREFFYLHRAANSIKHYRLRERRKIALARVQANFNAILRQKHWKRKGTEWENGLFNDGELEYCVAYKGSKTGRLFERGGGMQNMPKRLKKIAYEYVFDAHNYDIRSCH
jgi:hypothetical protein